MVLGCRKRGSIIDLVGIVLPLLLFCGIVMMAYLHEVPRLDAAIISPVPVLEMGDSRVLFETQEYLALREAYCNSLNVEETKAKFCFSFDSLDKSFLTENTRPVNSGLNLNNLCEGIYKFTSEGKNVRVVRSGLVKSEALKGEGSRNRFDMKMEFSLEKKYLLTAADCK